MSPDEKRLARHALGLPNKDKISTRNVFFATPGSTPHEIWISMAGRGLADLETGFPGHSGADLFCLTRMGAEQALAPGETLRDLHFPAGPEDPGLDM